MANKHPCHLDRRSKKGCGGGVSRRQKFARRSKGGQIGIVIKKRVEIVNLSSGESKTPPSVLSKNTLGLDSVGYGSVDEYQLLSEISHGSYGVVYKAMEKKTGQVVAIKEEFDGFCESTSREIDILKSVTHHPSFVGFKRVFVDQYDGVYVVMEYMENDLGRAMKNTTTPFDGTTRAQALIKQLLEGVRFLHENRIMHRDLKPSNILLNHKGEAKICDFGLSRRYERERAFDSYSPHVVTLWYRAPELLLWAKTYSCAVDIWAVGCIMAEVLLLGEVIFRGNSEMDQIKKVYEILGTPDDIRLPGFSSLPGSMFMFEEQVQPLNLLNRKFGPILSQVGIDLLSKLLLYNPEERITAKDALNHDWFREIIID
ncbi:cyclin-dependent kinase G-1-like [Henckelia pumila]|uniref:cyclin-dependent kinase G-1-like n=1 Tax=Henckelia pumila TaxID=405737 RepID=UPI003C6DD923